MTIEAIQNTAQVRRVWKDTGNDSFMNGQQAHFEKVNFRLCSVAIRKNI
jgi:hypothetical protein